MTARRVHALVRWVLVGGVGVVRVAPGAYGRHRSNIRSTTTFDVGFDRVIDRAVDRVIGLARPSPVVAADPRGDPPVWRYQG